MSRSRRYRDVGEPISSGRLPRSSCVATFRDAMFTVAFVAGVILINGLVGIALIAFMQSVGWWDISGG